MENKIAVGLHSKVLCFSLDIKGKVVGRYNYCGDWFLVVITEADYGLCEEGKPTIVGTFEVTPPASRKRNKQKPGFYKYLSYYIKWDELPIYVYQRGKLKIHS